MPENVAHRYRRKTSRLDDLLLQLVWRVGVNLLLPLLAWSGLLLSPDVALYRFKKTFLLPFPLRNPTVPGFSFVGKKSGVVRRVYRYVQTFGCRPWPSKCVGCHFGCQKEKALQMECFFYVTTCQYLSTSEWVVRGSNPQPAD